MDATHHPHADLIDKYCDYLKHRRRAARTIESYSEILRRAHRTLPYGLPVATRDELIAWLGQARAAKTQALETSAVKMFFRWAVRHQWLDRDPAETIERPTVPNRVIPPATTEQVTAILHGCREPVRTYALLAAYGGLRCIEITRLHREHITRQEMKVHGKGGRWRTVPTHAAVWDAVADLPPGPIADCDARSMHSRCWYAFRARTVRAETSMHGLRKWCGTQALHLTGNLAAVQDLLGHASPATTRLYASPSAEQVQLAIASLPVLTPAAAAAPHPPAAR